MKFETSFAAFQPSPIAKWNEIKIKSKDNRVSFAVAKNFFYGGPTALTCHLLSGNQKVPKLFSPCHFWTRVPFPAPSLFSILFLFLFF